MAATSRQKALFLATIAEEGARYDDMATHMEQVVIAANGQISKQERDLVSAAFKLAVRTRLTSLQALRREEKQALDNPEKKAWIKEYIFKVEVEIEQLCCRLQELLVDLLVPKAVDLECYIFYRKMQGDYARHMVVASSRDDNQKVEAAADAQDAYEDARSLAERSLPVYHPLRLAVILNMTVLMNEGFNRPRAARRLARKAFNDAIVELDNIPEAMYKDSTLVMQLLRDVFAGYLWDVDDDDDNET